MTDTNELRKLLAAATPLPWRVQFTGGGDSWQVVGSNARREAFDDGSACGEYSQSCTDPTRDLIVAAINGLPAMLDELDAARAEVERLRGLIREYFQGIDGLAVDDSAEAQNLYERAEDALREVARG